MQLYTVCSSLSQLLTNALTSWCIPQLFNNVTEQLFYSLSSTVDSRCLEWPCNFKVFRLVFQIVMRNFALGLQITFIADNIDFYSVTTMILSLLVKGIYRFETLWWVQCEDNQDYCCTCVVTSHHRLDFLLASRIPNIELHLTTPGHINSNVLVLHTSSWNIFPCVLWVEILMDESSLADWRVTNNDDLKFRNVVWFWIYWFVIPWFRIAATHISLLI